MSKPEQIDDPILKKSLKEELIHKMVFDEFILFNDKYDEIIDDEILLIACSMPAGAEVLEYLDEKYRTKEFIMKIIPDNPYILNCQNLSVELSEDKDLHKMLLDLHSDEVYYDEENKFWRNIDEKED